MRSCLFVHFRQLRCLVGCDAGINNLLNIAVHNLIKLVQCQINTMIRYTSLGEVIGTDLLGTVSGTDLASSGLCLCVVGFLALDIVKFCS